MINLFKNIFCIIISLFSLTSCSLVEFECPKINNNRANFEIYTLENNNTKIFHGFVRSQHLINLSFQSEGRIIYFPFSLGDFVKKGQVIARLDGELYKIQKQEELSRLNEAKIKQNRFNKYYKRVDMLHNAGAISDNDWEEAYFNLKTATEDIVLQKEKINYIEKQISYNEIKAPFDGYIYEKKSDIGAYASSAQPVVSIIVSDKTEVDVMVDSSVINDLRPSQIVKVRRDNTQYQGKIAHISKSSLQSGGYLIRIFLDKLYPDLKDGMSADVEFSVKNQVSVPLKYFLEDENGKNFVYKINKINQNKARVEKVLIANFSIQNDIVFINELSQGDEIIVFNDNLNSSAFKDYDGVEIKL